MDSTMTVQEARQLCLINKLPPTDENVKMFILQREEMEKELVAPEERLTFKGIDVKFDD
jgi:hypothetical protein